MNLHREDKLRTHIGIGLADDLQTANAVLETATRILNSLPPIGAGAEAPDFDELWISLGIFTKAFRQYRAVVSMMANGMLNDARSNCRLLLESMLMALFLMRPKVTLKKGEKQLEEVADRPLSRSFRTKLYLALDANNSAKILRGMAGVVPPENEEEKMEIARAEKHAAAMNDEIGEVWAKRQSKGKLAGLQILDLANSLSVGFVYGAFYRVACPSVHGADARKHVHLETDSEGRIAFQVVINPEGAAESLTQATLAFMEVVRIANERFAWGLDENVSALSVRVGAMKHELK